MKQHLIDRVHPPITEAMTWGERGHAHGTGMHDVVGWAVVTAYEIPDSDRGETLLLLSNGRVMMLSCDPGVADDDVTRTPERWTCCMYDATNTAAGRAIQALEPGHWL